MLWISLFCLLGPFVRRLLDIFNRSSSCFDFLGFDLYPSQNKSHQMTLLQPSYLSYSDPGAFFKNTKMLYLGPLNLQEHLRDDVGETCGGTG